MVGHSVAFPWNLSCLPFADDVFVTRQSRANHFVQRVSAWSGVVEHGVRAVVVGSDVLDQSKHEADKCQRLPHFS